MDVYSSRNPSPTQPSSLDLLSNSSNLDDDLPLFRTLKWMDDTETDVCLSCSSFFGLMLRKHHCRCCGQIFCSSCLIWMKIPKYIECPKPKTEKWINSESDYVCKSRCEAYIKSQIEISKIRELLVNEPPTIEGVITQYREQPKVIEHYFGLLSEMQHCYPNHKFHEYQKKMLKYNWADLSGHAKYVCQIIKSMSWRDTKVKDRVTRIVLNMLHERPKDCSHVRCIANCAARKVSNPSSPSSSQDKSSPLLNTDEVIGVLASGVGSSLPEPILDYLFDILRQDSLLYAYLPFIIKLVYTWDPSDLLLQRLSTLFTETNLIVQAYWFLRAAQDGAGDDLVQVRDIQSFLDKWDREKIRLIESDRLFFVSLVRATSESEVKRLLTMQSWPVTLPYNPKLQIVGYESVKELDSGSKPIKVVFKVQNINNSKERSSSTISILFKKSRVMQDLVAINIITLWLHSIKQGCPDVKTVLYPVMPIGPDTGMCQFVEECCTLSDIINKELELTQWFNAKNLNLTPRTILNNYVQTLVILTLAAHFLHIGDRHYENILLTNTGEIFHIDFDYILGDKPSVSAARSGIRLTSFMLKPIKHEGLDLYDIFLRSASSSAVLIHERINSTFALLSVVADEQRVASFISERFFLRSQARDIQRYMQQIITNSISDENVLLSGDTIHRLIREKTIQKGVASAAYGTYSAVSSVGAMLSQAAGWWKGEDKS